MFRASRDFHVRLVARTSFSDGLLVGGFTDSGDIFKVLFQSGKVSKNELEKNLREKTENNNHHVDLFTVSMRVCNMVFITS